MKLFEGVRRAFRRRPENAADLHREVDDELSFHLAMREERLRSRGLSSDEATAAARLRFGNVDAIRSECVDVDRVQLRWDRFGEGARNFLHDARVAMRSLARAPLLAVGTSLLLALGIGGTTAMFSVINAIYFRELPYPHADRLATIALSTNDAACTRGCARAPTPAEVERLALTKSLDAVGTVAITQSVMQLRDGSVVLEGAEVSRDIPSLLGLRAIAGRALLPADFANGAPNVIVLGHSAWVTQFGGDAAIVGQVANIDGTLYRIVGVLSESSELGPPIYSFNVRTAQYLTPMPASSQQPIIQVLGLLNEGTTYATAQSEVGAALGGDRGTWRAAVVPVRALLVDRYRGSFTRLLGAVAIVLLITCLNVTGLFLARINDRMPELATRAVLGAGRAQLLRCVVIELLIVAMIGGAGGLGIGYAGMRLTRLIPVEQLPFWTRITMDGRVAAFALVLTLGGAIALSIAPIIALSPTRVMASMRGLVDATPVRARLRGIIVGIEIALSVMLLGAAAVLTRQLVAAESRDLGWAKQSVVYASLLGPRGSRSENGAAWSQRVEASMRGLAGVSSVGLTGAPARQRRPATAAERVGGMGRGGQGPSVFVEGRDEPLTAIRFGPATAVSDAYFDAIGTRIVEGRAFGAVDVGGGTPVAIINLAAARRLFPDRSPIGQRFRVDDRTGSAEWLTVVGVTVDEHEPFSDAAPQRAILYRPFRQIDAVPQNAIVRVSRDTRQMAPLIRDALRTIDRTMPVASVLAIEDGVARRMFTARFNTDVFLGFATLALVLACLGVHATVSYVVARRRRELAIRMAVGADAGEVIRQVVGATNRVLLPGLIAGVVGSFATARLLRSMLYGSDGLDLLVLVVVSLLMWGAGIFAAYLRGERCRRM